MRILKSIPTTPTNTPPGPARTRTIVPPKGSEEWVCARLPNPLYRKSVLDVQESYSYYKALPDTHGPFSTQATNCVDCPRKRDDEYMSELRGPYWLLSEAFEIIWESWEQIRECVGVVGQRKRVREETVERARRATQRPNCENSINSTFGYVMTRIDDMFREAPARRRKAIEEALNKELEELVDSKKKKMQELVDRKQMEVKQLIHGNQRLG